MRLASVFSRSSNGIYAPQVFVEAQLHESVPRFSLVGLPETIVRESKDRVRCAINNTPFKFPYGGITVNLGPADVPKEGSRFDLPMAIAILAASRQIERQRLHDYEFAGELSLSGEIRGIKGALPFALGAKVGRRKLIIPAANAEEMALVKGIELYPAHHLTDVCAFLNNEDEIKPYLSQPKIDNELHHPDMNEVCGQASAKRALTIAAAGGHSLLMFGPPGTGKSMLASRINGILPAMTEQEALETAAVISINDPKAVKSQWQKRPFRAPHHSASSVAMVGGGGNPRPGEISLAHGGVLFLDELPEFSRHVLESLREPLETGTITISRAARQVEFPARFQLLAAMNPCPCGYLGDANGRCRCTSDQVARYRSRISGPLLDRLDMHIEIPRVPEEVLLNLNNIENESSTSIRMRVSAARNIQLQRAQKTNAHLTPPEIEKFCEIGNDEQKLLTVAIKRLRLSARSYHRILRVARTIADLEAADVIREKHITEAMSYRQWDRLMNAALP